MQQKLFSFNSMTFNPDMINLSRIEMYPSVSELEIDASEDEDEHRHREQVRTHYTAGHSNF